MILSNWYDRFAEEGPEQHEIVATYEKLMQAGRLNL